MHWGRQRGSPGGHHDAHVVRELPPVVPTPCRPSPPPRPALPLPHLPQVTCHKSQGTGQTSNEFLFSFFFFFFSPSRDNIFCLPAGAM